MPRYVIPIENKFLVWSTVVDAPLFVADSIEEIKLYNYIDLAIANQDIIDSIKKYNRAGPNESCLSLDEIVEFYINRENERDKAITKEELEQYRNEKR